MKSNTSTGLIYISKVDTNKVELIISFIISEFGK